MFRLLSANSEHILAITRILVGINFASHGAQKLFGLFGGFSAPMPLPMAYTAGVIELLGGLLIALGLLTNWAGFLASGLMAAGYFIAHAPQGFWPILNRGELAIVYCWFFLYLAARGPGAWSVDGLLTRGATADSTI
jgi:putative oxidoreductase